MALVWTELQHFKNCIHCNYGNGYTTTPPASSLNFGLSLLLIYIFPYSVDFSEANTSALGAQSRSSTSHSVRSRLRPSEYEWWKVCGLSFIQVRTDSQLSLESLPPEGNLLVKGYCMHCIIVVHNYLERGHRATARDITSMTSPIETNIKFTSAWQDQQDQASW